MLMLVSQQLISREDGVLHVARDCYGHVNSPGAGKLHHVDSTQNAKAQACVAALHQAAAWGMTSIEFL
jgi:hypothetical protein